jgi:DNA-binding response OmpR family regulator
VRPDRHGGDRLAVPPDSGSTIVVVGAADRWTPVLETAGYLVRELAWNRLGDPGGDEALVLLLPSDDAPPPWALVARLRTHSGVPTIVMLTADDDADCVRALRAGADDCVDEDISGVLLLARVRAALRRATARAPAADAPIGIDAPGRRAMVRGTPLDLTRREFDLLRHLVAAPDRVHHREQLLSAVWHGQEAVHPATVTEHVRRLRAKIARAGGPADCIETVRGIGYRYVPPPRSRRHPA